MPTCAAILCSSIDLSVGSQLITAAMLASGDHHALAAAIDAAIQASGAQIGAGGYGEPRAVYAGDAFAVNDNPTGERRTVHVGIDLFAPAGSPIYAPLAGEVFAWNDNAARFDYGPVVILRHLTDDGQPFYTLYGHLSRTSLHGLPRVCPWRLASRLARSVRRLKTATGRRICTCR